ncbi:MAG: PEP-CTERM sorting domain-containing protein [Proteobacteria bacterium]|nr:PEP-CTERM sorting domain-containing protein [Pseudomonadota bacterium]
MKQPNSATPPNAWSDADKLALATGSLSALSLLSFGADASVIYNNTNPVAINFNHASGIGSAITWSVDGTNATFKLFNRSGSGYDNLHLKSNGGLLGRGLVKTNGQTNINGFVKLPAGFSVGPTLAANYLLPAGGSLSYRTLLKRYSNFTSAGNLITTNISILSNAKNFTSGADGFFGFRFTDAGLANQFYGWAELNLNTTSPGTATINRWAYESCTGQSITAGATSGGATTCGGSTVPEPDALSLTLLGLGAGGVRAWRKRKLALAA